jgi:hypothetical protein
MLFNNCDGRPHAQYFGAGAFFDLNLYGQQASMAVGLQPGHHCCVATYTDGGDIELAWYRFSHERVMPNPTEQGAQVRVLFGEPIGSETQPKAEAAATPPYSGLFDTRGYFKQRSVIQPEGGCTAPPRLSPA